MHAPFSNSRRTLDRPAGLERLLCRSTTQPEDGEHACMAAATTTVGIISELRMPTQPTTTTLTHHRSIALSHLTTLLVGPAGSFNFHPNFVLLVISFNLMVHPARRSSEPSLLGLLLGLALFGMLGHVRNSNI